MAKAPTEISRLDFVIVSGIVFVLLLVVTTLRQSTRITALLSDHQQAQHQQTRVIRIQISVIDVVVQTHSSIQLHGVHQPACKSVAGILLVRKKQSPHSQSNSMTHSWISRRQRMKCLLAQSIVRRSLSLLTRPHFGLTPSPFTTSHPPHQRQRDARVTATNRQAQQAL